MLEEVQASPGLHHSVVGGVVFLTVGLGVTEVKARSALKVDMDVEAFVLRVEADRLDESGASSPRASANRSFTLVGGYHACWPLVGRK